MVRARAKSYEFSLEMSHLKFSNIGNRNLSGRPTQLLNPLIGETDEKFGVSSLRDLE